MLKPIVSKPHNSFKYQASPNIPELLYDLGCCIAFSTYQAGKVVIFSANSPQSLIQMPRDFGKPMGIAISGEKLAIGTRNKVIQFRNVPSLAKSYPEKPNVYDALYLPRTVYFTSNVDLHDLTFVNEVLVGVNTRFSCLVRIDEDYSFKPVWKPKFISKLKSEDRCHLNGLAVKDNDLLYVSALGQTDEPRGWHENRKSGGVLIHIPSNEVVLSGLAMPHSPLFIDGDLYLLLSATGELIKADPERGTYEQVLKVNSFIRGMSYIDGYLFVGFSKIRKTSKEFQELPVSTSSEKSGILVIDLKKGVEVGRITYDYGVDEIYDVKILKGMRRANIIRPDQDVHLLAINTPNGNYWKKIKEKD